MSFLRSAGLLSLRIPELSCENIHLHLQSNCLGGIPEYPLFIGYGSIGISNEEGKIDRGSDTEDLIILEAEAPDWERIRIFYFPAMIKKLEEVMTHISNKFTKKIY